MTPKIPTMFAGLALVLSACGQQQPGMTLEQLLDEHTAARGGGAVIEAVASMGVELEIIEPEFTVTGNYLATRDGLMRIDIFADGARVFTEALSSDGGWQMFGDGTIEDVSPEGAAALRRGVESNLYGMHELPGLGYSMTLAGKTERNGATYWDIEQVAPDGFSKHLFIDPDTFRIATEIKTSALHPDLDPTQIRQETYYSDYVAIAGVLFSNQSETRNIDSGETMQRTLIKSRRINGPIDPNHFARPEQEN